MITTRELRTGLYFNVPRKDQCPFRIDLIEHLSDNYAKVGMSSGTYKLAEIEMEGHPLTWELKDLEPILLNEQWLRDKFKLEPAGFGKYRYKDRLIIKRGDFFYDYGSGKQFEFVHRLQNFIYELTDTELSINEK
jgi:hypothetical protein